jgi:hypothetical protein
VIFKQIHGKNEANLLTNEEYDVVATQVGKMVYEISDQYQKPVGRPSLGRTKKVSLTLPDEI